MEVHFVLLLSWIAVGGACPILGCNGAGSNTLNVLTAPPLGQQDAKLLWKQQTKGVQRHLCVSADDVGSVVCAADRGSPTATGVPGLIAWNTSGSSLWESWEISSSTAYPLLSESGTTIATDGALLVGYDERGVPLGTPINMESNHGSKALALTDNDVVIIVERTSGLIAGYLTDGVPHASMLLLDTVHGVAGQFMPISNPVVKQSTDGSLTRVVVLTRFRAKAQNKISSSGSCRAYAIDVHRTMGNRMEVAWNYTFACSVDSTDHGEGADVPLLTNGNTIMWARTLSSSDTHCLFVQDHGSSVKLIHSVQVASSVMRANSLTWMGPADKPQLWVSFRNDTLIDTESDRGILQSSSSTLVAIDIYTGAVVVNTELPDVAVMASSRVMSFYSPAQNVRGLLLLATQRDSTASPKLVAVKCNASTITPLWSVELPCGEACSNPGNQIIELGASAVLAAVGDTVYAVGTPISL